MLSNFQHDHIVKRLRIVHASGLAVITVFFLLFFLLGRYSDIDTSAVQIILLAMGMVLGFGYLVVLTAKQESPKAPLFFFFLLNILTTALVWATGTFRSPFIAIYIILILLTSQLYHYIYGIIQTVTAFLGLVFVYTATTNLLLPYRSITSGIDLSTLYQPTHLVLLYGGIYGLLFLLTVFSASNARVILFRPLPPSEMNSTYHEHIIATMPLGVYLLDSSLRILSGNPAAAAQFPIHGLSRDITDYLSLSKVRPSGSLERLAKTHEVKKLLWKLDTGEMRPVELSVELQKGTKKEDDTFILFLR